MTASLPADANEKMGTQLPTQQTAIASTFPYSQTQALRLYSSARLLPITTIYPALAANSESVFRWH